MDDPDATTSEDGSGSAEVAGLGISVELYQQLKRLAHHHLRSHRKDMTLNCTALVHEAFLKMQQSSAETPESSEHFASVASMAMRQILVDYIRKKNASKYGGDAVKVTLQESSASTEAPSIDVLALDDALQKLGDIDRLLEKVVVLKFFGGFSTAETATALDRSVRSIERDWTRARLYLYRDLGLADDRVG
jgi:RNA polymerase sigma factor (TIGR02999 family)